MTLREDIYRARRGGERKGGRGWVHTREKFMPSSVMGFDGVDVDFQRRIATGKSPPSSTFISRLTLSSFSFFHSSPSRLFPSSNSRISSLSNIVPRRSSFRVHRVAPLSPKHSGTLGKHGQLLWRRRRRRDWPTLHFTLHLRRCPVSRLL